MDTYPVVTIGTGKATHALETFGWRETLCGLGALHHGESPTEPGTPVTCKRCRRSLEARPATNERARRTLAIGQQ
jgi:hypothetical protein